MRYSYVDEEVEDTILSEMGRFGYDVDVRVEDGRNVYVVSFGGRRRKYKDALYMLAKAFAERVVALFSPGTTYSIISSTLNSIIYDHTYGVEQKVVIREPVNVGGREFLRTVFKLAILYLWDETDLGERFRYAVLFPPEFVKHIGDVGDMSLTDIVDRYMKWYVECVLLEGGLNV